MIIKVIIRKTKLFTTYVGCLYVCRQTGLDGKVELFKDLEATFKATGGCHPEYVE